MTTAQPNSALKLLDNSYYSVGFPNEQWDQLISRTNYMSQIEDALTNGTKLFFIEGDEDSGKTTLCAQFTRKYVTTSISIFFNPLNNLDFQIDYFCTNVVLQVSHILKEVVDDEKDRFISTEQYRQKLYQLRKALRRERGKINLIIDGLEYKVKESPEFIRDLFSIIPFGEEYFRVIISGNKSDFLDAYNKLKREDSKVISLAGFSDSEIVSYLGIDKASSFELKDLYKVTKGYPGRLKTLKRLIQNEGYSLEKISSTTTYTTWLEMDCESIDLGVAKNNVIVSLLSLNEHSYTCEEISKICSLKVDEVEQIVNDLSIIEYSGKNVSITSTAHKRYLSNILRTNKQKIDELLINYYAQNDSLNSLIDLPKLFSVKKEWGKVIQLLDEKYFNKILERTGSLKIVNETLELGVQASEKSNRHSDLLRYSIQGSIVNELDNYHFWESEIEARISINDFNGAISLAESSIVLVDRLRLLALIARRQKEFNSKVDEVLTNLIKELYQTIDLTSVGDKIYDIVSDLIYALPNLAIEMIEKSSDVVSNNNINDWVVAKLSIAAIDSSLKDDQKEEDSKKIEAVQKLNNPSVKKINRAISFLVGNYTAAKVLEEVKKISDSEERLKLLRLWLNNNKINVADVESVIEAALNELVSSSSDSSITVEVLNELSSQLPYVKNRASKETLYKKLKSLENDISDFGLAKKKYIYQLNMVHTEFTLYGNNAVSSVNRIIKDIEAINDTLIKLESYSETYSKLCVISSKNVNDKINFIYSRILLLSSQLFDTTASHFKISKYFLQTIGRRNPNLALKIIEKMNTVVRRENARLLVLEAYLDNNLRNVKIDTLKAIEESLEQDESKGFLYLNILERYSEAKSLHFKVILLLLYYWERINLIQSSSIKVRSLGYLYKIIVKNEDWKKRIAIKIEQQIYGTWKQIEADWDRIDIGFTMCYQLADITPDFSKKLFYESEQIKNASWLDSRRVAYTYLYSIKLIIRAYYGLLMSSTNTIEDYKIVEDLIARVPSEIEKLSLWIELGFSSYSAQREDFSKKIVDDHVILIVHDLISRKADVESILDALTLIHIFNADLAMGYIKKISRGQREVALVNICNYYVTKRNPFEVYEENIFKYNSSFSDLVKAVNILSQINTDSNVYYLLNHMCKAINDNKDLSRLQVSTLLNQIKEVTNQKFPDQRNIKHEGYKILAEAKIALIDRGSVDNNSLWSSLIKRADSVSNKSDSIFIKSLLLEDIPFDKIKNGSNEKKKLYDDIIEALKLLPAHYEFVQRVIDVSEIMYQADRVNWKKVVNQAFDISASLKEGSDIYNTQKSIIDSMYRLDSGYAKELIKQVDKENQQNKISKLLHKHYETLEIADRIRNNKSLEEKDKAKHRDIVNSVYMALKGLNSEKVTPKRISELMEYLTIGNKLPLHEVFPIYIYYLNNCARTYKSAKDGSVSTLHRDNFKEAVSATNLIQILSQRKKISEKSYRKFFIDEEFSTNKPVRPNSREAAFTFIKSWIMDQVEDFIIIADPYFEKEDLEVLKIIKELKTPVEIDILGSKDANTADVEELYKRHWRKISDEEPPFTNVTFCKTQDSETPFHDRWILTKNSGLRIGTSINSLGVKRESEISVMKPNEALKIREETLMEYITRRKKTLNNQRVQYKSFSL